MDFESKTERIELLYCCIDGMVCGGGGVSTPAGAQHRMDILRHAGQKAGWLVKRSDAADALFLSFLGERAESSQASQECRHVLFHVLGQW